MQLLWSLSCLCLLLAGGALSFQLNPRQNARRAPVSGSKLDAVENLGIVGGGTGEISAYTRVGMRGATPSSSRRQAAKRE